MTNFSGKLPWVQNMAGAMDWRYGAQSEEMGWQLPCTVTAISNDGLFVTVKFAMREVPYQLPEVTIPISQSQYIRLPIQVGDVGLTKYSEVSNLPITGKVSSAADFSNVGNLNSVLTFEPVVNVKFPTTADRNVLWMYGPNGVLIQDEAGNSKVTISPTMIKLQSGSSYITINKDGEIDIQGSSVKIMGKDFLTHEHGLVQPGTGNSGGVV